MEIDFGFDYQDIARKFTRYVSNSCSSAEVYIIPGNSGAYLANWMRLIAQQETLAIPALIELSHSQSGELRFHPERLFRLLEPAINNDTLHIIEDFAYTGNKLQLVIDSTRKNMRILTNAKVMIAGRRINRAGVDVFMINNDYAYNMDRIFQAVSTKS